MAEVLVLFSVKSSQPTTLVEILSQYDLSQTLHGEEGKEERRNGGKEERKRGKEERKIPPL